MKTTTETKKAFRLQMLFGYWACPVGKVKETVSVFRMMGRIYEEVLLSDGSRAVIARQNGTWHYCWSLPSQGAA